MNILAIITAYKAMKNDIDMKEKKLEEMKQQIISYMNGKEEITIGQYKASNKECTRNGIDEKALKELYPDIALQLAKTTVYKRFTVK